MSNRSKSKKYILAYQRECPSPTDILLYIVANELDTDRPTCVRIIVSRTATCTMMAGGRWVTWHSTDPPSRIHRAHSGGARVFAARDKRLCCRSRQSDQFCSHGIFQDIGHPDVNQFLGSSPLSSLLILSPYLSSPLPPSHTLPFPSPN